MQLDFFSFFLIFLAVLLTLPLLSLGNIVSIHVHSVQTIPANAFPRSRLPGVPYQAAALHESCAVALLLREGQPRIPVVPPDTGYPRASFRSNGGGLCPSVTDVCSQPFFVTFEVSVLRSPSDSSSQEPPILHVSELLTYSSEPNIAFFDDPPLGHSSVVSPRVLSTNRPTVQSLHYSLKTMTSGCGSLQLQLHFVTDGHLEHSTEEFVIGIPTWGKEVLDFHLLREAAAASPSPFFDLSMQPPPCRPVNWDEIEQLSDHRALVAAVELPSPFAIAFVPMMAVPPLESRAVARFWSNMNLSDKDSGGSFVGDQIYATGLYSPTETSLFLFILRERCSELSPDGRPPLVIDAGANIGYFTLLSMSLGCRVLAFEPQLRLFPALKRSLYFNNFNANKLLALIPCALASSHDVLTSKDHHNWGEWSLSHSIPDGNVSSPDGPSGLGIDANKSESNKIQATTLDALVQEDILLFKMDVEGFEVGALQGSMQLLENYRVSYVLIEIKLLDDRRRIISKMKQIGYGCMTFSVSYSTDIRLAKALHPARTALQFDRLLSTLWITSTPIDVPASRQRTDESQVSEQIGWPCTSDHNKEDFLFYK